MSIVLSSYKARIEATEKTLAIEALTINKGSIQPAARQIGLHPFQLRRIISRHNLQNLLAKRVPMATGGNSAWRALGDE